jgi:hypothetical protein
VLHCTDISMANPKTMRRHPLTLLVITGWKLGLPPLLVLGGIAGAWGETARSDPTVPPPAWTALQPQAPGNAALMNHDESSGMRMILIGPSRQLAVIDGKVVKPGDVHNGSKVLAIKAGEAVMQDGSKSLKVTPGVVKTVVASVPPKKSGGDARKIKTPGKEPVNASGGTQ